MPQIETEKVMQRPEPSATITDINKIGELKLTFSDVMLFEEIFADFQFTQVAQVDKTSKEEEEGYQKRRL